MAESTERGTERQDHFNTVEQSQLTSELPSRRRLADAKKKIFVLVKLFATRWMRPCLRRSSSLINPIRLSRADNVNGLDRFPTGVEAGQGPIRYLDPLSGRRSQEAKVYCLAPMHQSTRKSEIISMDKIWNTLW